MAYAAVLSLMETLKQILDADDQQHLLDHKKHQFESLLGKACSLQDFLEDSWQTSSEAVQSLEQRIREAAYTGDDLIMSRMSRTEGFLWQVKFMLQTLISAFWPDQDLEKVIEEIDSIMKEVMEFKDGGGVKDSRPRNSLTAGPSTQAARVADTMVGFDDDLVQLKDRLIGQQSKLQIIPIVGMGGIGKTTLAKNTYQDPFVVYHFDIRAWVTVSQEYCLREILLCLLDCTTKGLTNEMHEEGDEELCIRLYKSLKGRRYLVVIDDVWTTKAWDDIKMLFPDDSSGSRIVLTTRLSNIAAYVNSCNPHHQMRFLNDDESWKLLQEKACVEENYLELEKFGKEIAENCRVLPLTIAVIGGVLSKHDKTQDIWEHIAKNVSSFVTSNDEQCLRILSLSYNYLPHHLRPCFLYMGVFPEDYEIRVSKLIKLWVAEGFLKPIISQSLEEVAMKYLQDLIDRNLVLIRQRGSNGMIKSCSIHDLLLDLCLREGRKEKFLCVTKVTANTSLNVTNGGRRLIIYENSVKGHDASASLIRANNDTLKSASAVRSFIVQVVLIQHHQYLAYTTNGKLPSSISVLRNLQTLIVHQMIMSFLFKLPPEIWEMPQLRHICFTECALPDLCCGQIEGAVFIFPGRLETLQLSGISCFTEDNCRRVENVKKLGIKYDHASARGQWERYSLNNLGQLHELENLKCLFGGQDYLMLLTSPRKLPPPMLTFPPNLKKLTLSGCLLPWEDMTHIGSLPKLEVLKLHRNAFSGDVWEPIEGEFLRLKYLKLHHMDLAEWRADETHFPSLQHLILKICRLKEIPSGIGEIPTLELIQLDDCYISTVTSAIHLKEEQQSLGNDGLKLFINYSTVTESTKKLISRA
ncbi:putative late blight resistance proteinR1B-12 [Sesamum alatum]|uniref:Late blight resistance proteinR1B-12 n=1 Tax=Sesamum alatum TaxID=300844 RepID=A0AAE1XLQ3_9LAMI|nr:putative late blight resistance proteinR1B-12 [Sesamum alatum]